MIDPNISMGNPNLFKMPPETIDSQQAKIMTLFQTITERSKERYYYDIQNEQIVESKDGIEKNNRVTIYKIKNGEYFLKGKQIGQGKDNIIYLDMKLSKQNSVQENFVVRAIQRANLRSEELDIYQRISSQHVVGCFDVFDKVKGNKTKRTKILEYCEKGEMCDDAAFNTFHSSKPGVFIKLFCDVMKGFKALHKLGYVHCDTHTGNILLKERKGEIIPKVIDFGGARKIDDLRDPETLEKMNEENWTRCPVFVPPEILFWENKNISEKADTWGIAIAMLKEYPFQLKISILIDKIPDITKNHKQDYPDQYAVYKILHAEAKPEDQGGLDYIFWRMLAPEANDRPDDDEIITLLEKLLN